MARVDAGLLQFVQHVVTQQIVAHTAGQQHAQTEFGRLRRENAR